MQKIVEKMSSYLIIILFAITFLCFSLNFLHQKQIDKKVFVNPDDTSYQEYQKVVLDIDNKLVSYKNNKQYDQKTVQKLKDGLKGCLSTLKNSEGLYEHNGNLGYYDVYRINSYFQNTIINECWNVNMSFIREGNYKGFLKNNFEIYDDYVKKINKDADYVKYELLNNSNFHYDFLKVDVHESLQSEYDMIQNNYVAFSKIILDMSNFLVDGDNYE